MHRLLPFVGGQQRSRTTSRERSHICAYTVLFLGFFERAEILRPLLQSTQAEPLGPPRVPELLHYALDNLTLFTAIHANPGERNLADAEIDQTPAEFADHVVVLLRHADL